LARDPQLGRHAHWALLSRPDVDPDRIGLMGVSLGGYHSTRWASMDKRFRACVAWGATWDYEATWRWRIDQSIRLSLSVPGHHILWVLGAANFDGALERLAGFRLDGVIQQMNAAFLLTHGEQDEQIPLADGERLYAATVPARLPDPRSDGHLRLAGRQALARYGRSNCSRLMALPWAADEC
jgi:fermentation-respiration switch protein FrsA (DUF1100 family)